MKQRVSILLLIGYLNVLTGQNSWQTKDYSNWDYTNFRSNKLFQQVFSTSDPDYLLLNAAVFFITNEQRSKLGISILPHHKLLEVAAYNHSMKMATTGFFSHRNPKDASRARTKDRGHLAGIANPKFAENIAYFSPKDGNSYIQVAEELIDIWMNSPGHRSNILSTKGKQMGAGTYYLNGRIYGTQVFQWFYFVTESQSGGTDKLPSPKFNSNGSGYQNAIKTRRRVSNATSIKSNSDNSKPIKEITNSNRRNNSKDQTISQLRKDKSNLNKTIYQLQKRQTEKDAQYNLLYTKYKLLSTQKTKNKTKSNEPNALTFKMGIIAFYPSIGSSTSSDFDQRLISYGGEAMMGINHGTHNKINSIGVTVRAIQTNRHLTKLIDPMAEIPYQYYDAELTTIYREWLSFGVGISYITNYGLSDFTINPSASIGICIGPKNWKLQLFQQASLTASNSIVGRTSTGFFLVL